MDITLKEIPDGITEEQLQEWCEILVKRQTDINISANPAVIEATNKANAEVDKFRKANGLKAIYTKEEVE